MYQQGLTKSLSVSNFSPAQLDCIVQSAKLTQPVVNQLPYSVAYHPGHAIAENQRRGILVQAWAPLGGSLGGTIQFQYQGHMCSNWQDVQQILCTGMCTYCLGHDACPVVANRVAKSQNFFPCCLVFILLGSIALDRSDGRKFHHAKYKEGTFC